MSTSTLTTTRAMRKPCYERRMLSSRRIMLLAAICSVEATVPGDHNPRFHDHQSSLQPPSTIFNQQLEFDLKDESLNLSSETDFLAFYSDNKSQQDGPSTPRPDDDRTTNLAPASPLVASSTWAMYDKGCFVSSEALMCHGGGGGGDSMLLYTSQQDVVNQRNNNNNIMDSPDKDDEEEDHDDEDDNDDGHSSMLSNASLRRPTRIFTAVATVSSERSATYSSGAKASSAAMISSPSSSSSSRRGQSIAFSRLLTKSLSSPYKTPSKLTAKLVNLRGGATSANMGSEFAKKLLVAALVTLIYEAVLGHILEFVKIVMQTSPPGTSYWDVIHSITSEKGIAGLWDGFCPWGILQSIFKGGVFGLAHAMVTQLLQPLVQQGFLTVPAAATLAGGLAGGCQGYVLSPTLLLKTRVMTNPVFRDPMSLLQTTWMSARIGWDVVQIEGFSALMKGANIFALKRVFDWATRFLFSDLLESWFHSLKGGSIALSATEKSLASFLGGTASTLSTLPLDVLVAKTQDAKKAGVKVSAIKLFQEDLKEGGWSGVRDNYLRGFAVRLAHVCLTTVVMKTGSPIVYDALFGKST